MTNKDKKNKYTFVPDTKEFLLVQVVRNKFLLD